MPSSSPIRVYEREALVMLCAGRLDESILYAALSKPKVVSCEFTGAGYYLQLRHPDIPEGRIVCDSPNLLGRYQEIDVGFVAFIENGQITLECYSYGHRGVPEEIRNGVVTLSAI